jgi:hypothetical protein
MNWFKTWRAAVLAAGGLAAIGCGGGSGGGNKGSPGSSACETLCEQLVACATTLGSDVGTLTGDSNMTSANCVSECTSLTCSDASSFTSCASGVSCSSVSAVQTSLSTCSSNAGCSGGNGGGGDGPFIQALVLSMSDGSAPPFGFSEQVKVCSDSSCSSPITDATVKVNGTTISWDSSHDEYRGTVVIAAGASATVSVSSGGSTYTGTGTQYAIAPTISGSMSTTWTASSSNTISWSGGSPTTGASYFVGVLDGSGNFAYPAGDHGPQEVSTSSTSQVVPPSTISAGSYSVMVGIGTVGLAAETGGISIANAASGSGMWLGLIRTPFTSITVN